MIPGYTLRYFARAEDKLLFDKRSQYFRQQHGIVLYLDDDGNEVHVPETEHVKRTLDINTDWKGFFSDAYDKYYFGNPIYFWKVYR